MIMTLTEQFQTAIEDFLSRTGMTPTAFGKDCLKDPNFVFDLRRGRSPSAAVMDRVQAYIASRGQDAA